MPPTGSGSGPVPPTGSGSGPMPPTGSGSGSAPTGEGMQCSCKCDCPDGSGQCDCNCNCPMQSMAMVCAPGFTRVCPMMEEDCPTDMKKVCPWGEEETRSVKNRMAGSSSGCQCVPDFLMSLMKDSKEDGRPYNRAVDSKEDGRPYNRAVAPDVLKNQKIKMGKITCTCSFSLLAAGTKMSPKSTAFCDKKCTGTAKKVTLKGQSGNVYTFDLKAARGKAKMSKGTVKLGSGKPPGKGSGKPPGKGSGKPPGSGKVSGSGSGKPSGGGEMVGQCTCVATGMG